MPNGCNSTSCKMNHSGDGIIPENLQEKWTSYVKKIAIQQIAAEDIRRNVASGAILIPANKF